MHLESEQEYTFISNQHPLKSGRPTLLMIHGSGQSALLWQKQIHDIPWTGNIIALDLPGHGRSRTKGKNRVEDYASWVEGFIKAMGLKSVMPAGHSMGGAIVQQMLINAPQEYAAAILINTGARLRVSPSFFDLINSSTPAWLATYYEYSTHAPNRNDELRAMFDQITACPAVVTENDFRACDRFDIMDKLTAISCPVQVLAAEHDQLTPIKYGYFLADHIPQARIDIIPDAGHFSPVENPTASNAAIAHFLHSGDVH
jgi:pimeloyl-ACP methyl ester carboxylesterase